MSDRPEFPGSHHLARAPEDTFASSAGLREECERLREGLNQIALNGRHNHAVGEHFCAPCYAQRAVSALRLGGGR